MNKQINMSPVSVGNAKHISMVSNHDHNWQGYEALHANAFAEAGRQPLVVCNEEGAVIARNSDRAALSAVNGTLRHEDFLSIQDRVVEVRRRALNGIADLREAGLSFSENISTQLVGFEKINEFQAARQDMNPNVNQNNDTVYTEDFVPLPIAHQSWNVPWRQTGFDYKRSAALPESVRQVAERLENTLFNGNAAISVTFNNNPYVVYGYTTHPNRGQGTISDWTVLANYDKIVSETITQIGLMWSTQGGVANDSVVMYVANDLWTIMQNDYVAAFPSDPIIDRLKEIAQIREVKPAEKLAAGQVMLVEMSERTVQLAVAADLITVPHTKDNPFDPQTFTTYGAMVQQIKVDTNGNTGIRHLTT